MENSIYDKQIRVIIVIHVQFLQLPAPRCASKLQASHPNFPAAGTKQVSCCKVVGWRTSTLFTVLYGLAGVILAFELSYVPQLTFVYSIALG
jgi:hypothetical protein